MTIFGFNTDAKVGETVYHVQSEARENDLLLQTQVFVKGHCIGKRASSYAERFVQPEYTIELMHELLKQQHRMVLEAVREDRAKEIFCTDGGRSKTSDCDKCAVQSHGLDDRIQATAVG